MQYKTIYFVAGLPRSGSTLLMNILGQNPRFHVTATSGILDMLVQIRNHWDQNFAFRAMPRQDSDRRKHNVLQAMLQAYFRDAETPVCIDKNRGWLEFLEMAAALLGGKDNIKVLVTVRDLRDVLASFELRHRETTALGQIPQEAKDPINYKTALGRLKSFIGKDQPVGRAYNAIRDAVTRGWRAQMHFIEYEAFTAEAEKSLTEIYRFLGETHFEHTFDKVQQITVEDDFIHGFRGLHTIQGTVSPQPPRWPKIYDSEVTETETWQDIEKNARFWRAYLAR